MGWGQAVCMKLSAERVSGTPLTARLMHQSLGLCLHLSSRASLASGRPGTLKLHRLLPLQLFPPTHRALTTSQALSGGAFPSPAEGPLGRWVRAHPFPVPPQLRCDSGWKVSLLKMGGSSFLPGGPGTWKTQSEWGRGVGLPGLCPERSDLPAVTQPQAQAGPA